MDQIPMYAALNSGHWDLFGIWAFEFGILKTLASGIFSIQELYLSNINKSSNLNLILSGTG
jgi:hypothetical protein